jgi:hypothetical protein
MSTENGGQECTCSSSADTLGYDRGVLSFGGREDRSRFRQWQRLPASQNQEAEGQATYGPQHVKGPRLRQLAEEGDRDLVRTVEAPQSFQAQNADTFRRLPDLYSAPNDHGDVHRRARCDHGNSQKSVPVRVW